MKTLKKQLLGIIIGIIIGISITVSATTIIAGNYITYDNRSSNLTSTNVQGAIDEINDEIITGDHVWNK